MEIGVLLNFLLAIALGALIGLEREYARYRNKGHAYAGIRTFPLIALAGALAALLGQALSIWILLISIGFMGILVVVAYYVTAELDRTHIGTTSEIAGFITFFIGILTFYQQYLLAVALTALTALILYARSLLHHFAEKLTRKEMLDTIVFVLLAFVILPLLPNNSYGPFEIFNPYITGLMVVLISGISFVGYGLMKWFGERGIGLSGIFGGLVSSTVVTMDLAQRSKKEKAFYALALGVILANGIMFIRVLFEVFVVHRPLFVKLLIPLLVLSGITAIFSFFLWRKIKKVKSKVALSSPLALVPAVKFALFFSFMIAVVKVTEMYLSSRGVYIVSFFSGFANVDAISLSLSQLARGNLAVDVAARGIIIAALTNIAVKGGMAYWFGGKAFRNLVVGLFSVLIVFGIVMMIWL
ncbi:MAG TPA: MgtC/SapB family protein [Candidatus Nanoarchaeia archaeon]|nr:MgtC/SapB family protein [Candidatus Nanoarchaeia archaeon]